MHRLKIFVGSALLIITLFVLTLSAMEPISNSDSEASVSSMTPEQLLSNQKELQLYKLHQQELKEAIKAYFDKALASGDIVGAGVSIVKGDSIVISDGFGKRHINFNDGVDGETIFTGLSNDDVNVTFDSNRFNTAVVEAPIEFRWRSSTAKDYSFWRVYAGFRVGYTYWYKATFSQPGNNVNQTDIPEYDRVRLNTTLSFGYSKINFYANYSILSLIHISEPTRPAPLSRMPSSA